jgi:hypothetical protein
MKLFFTVLLMSTSVWAKDLTAARIVNLINDDEGTKVIAQVGTQKPVVLYLSQSNVGYMGLNAALQKAKTEGKTVRIKTNDSDINFITLVESK